MAQLFQPTNITPDTRGAFGNGVVTIDNGATIWVDVCNVSWQVNGNVPMVAFQIDFTKMDGTPLYSTGKLTDGCPFYGTGQDGSPELFTFDVIQDDIETSFLRKASEGLMRITQWWGDGANDSITQLSPSHYIVREALVAHWTVWGGQPVTGRNATFTGTFSGAEQDGLMWIRWVLESITYKSGRITSRRTVKDTGRLYGSVNPVFSYDGFLPGDYWLTLSGETSSGVVSDLGEDILHVSYDMSDAGVHVVASRDCNGESAVSVRWPRLQSILPTSMSGDITDNGRVINLPTDESYITWSSVNGTAMNLSAPWSAVWSGSVTALGSELFKIQTQNARYGAHVTGIGGNGVLLLTIDVQVESGPPVPPKILTLDAEWNEGQVMCILTPTAVYWKFISDKGASLYPQEYLHPSETLYPGGIEGTTIMILRQDIPSYITQTNITSVSMYGRSSVDYFQILDHAMQEAEINRYLAGDVTANYGIDSLFYIGPRGREQDYNAGNYPEALQNGTSIQIYRKSNDSSVLEYAGKMNAGAENEFLDYVARSQQGPYTYYMYVLSSDKYINVPSVSNEVNPCFWDWTVLSCTENTDGSYSVQASYRFGKNLQSGNISNNNQPGIFQNFTPYPTVMIAPQNYQGGTLQSLIGVTKDGEYSDTIDLRDAIYNLSLTTNALFLKNRKGDLMRIRPSGEINMETMDNTRQQALTVSFPWVEVGDASGVAIYGTGGAS